MITTRFLAGAPQTNNSLGAILFQIPPAHVLDTVAAAILWALAVAYLFPKQTWDTPDSHDIIYYERPQNTQSLGRTKSVTRNIAQRLEELVSCQDQPPYLRGVMALIPTEQRRCDLLGLTVWHVGNIRRTIRPRTSSASRSGLYRS